MDKVTYVRTKYRQDQWEKLIAECQSSGLQVDKWCKKNQVSRHAYYYWLRKIRMKACETILPAIPDQNKSIAFAKVELPSRYSASPVITIHLSGASVDVRDGVGQQTIESVLLALKKIC
jgi:transposase-like protein